ncbi:hypothetical protein AB5N19_14439 [Seiridium cardinale]
MPGHKKSSHASSSHASSSQASSSHSTFADFQLTCGVARLPDGTEKSWCELLGVDPKNEEWLSFIIGDMYGTSLHSCAVSIAHRAYVILSVDLLNDDAQHTRKTEMRLHQMIVDGYFQAGGDTKDLRYLVFFNISNPTVKTAMDAQFKKDGYPSTEPTATTEPSPDPSKKISKNNRFIQTAKVAGQHIGKRIKRMYLFRDDGTYHMVVRFEKK